MLVDGLRLLSGETWVREDSFETTLGWQLWGLAAPQLSKLSVVEGREEVHEADQEAASHSRLQRNVSDI